MGDLPKDSILNLVVRGGRLAGVLVIPTPTRDDPVHAQNFGLYRVCMGVVRGGMSDFGHHPVNRFLRNEYVSTSSFASHLSLEVKSQEIESIIEVSDCGLFL